MGQDKEIGEIGVMRRNHKRRGGIMLGMMLGMRR